MPIVFSQPEPVAPGISSAYGAAEQYSKDLPSLVSLQEAAARLNAQAASQAAATSYESAAHTQAGNQFNAQLQARQYADQADLTQQGNLAQFHADSQAALQSQQAQLHSWLNQQDITQQETMRLQQLGNARASIEQARSNGTLTDAEANQALFDIAQPAQMLQQRLQATQQRKLQQDIQREQEQTKQQTKFNATTLEDRIQYRPDANALAAAERKVPPVPPGLSVLDAAAATAARKIAVNKEVAESGGMVPWIMQKDGTFEQGKPHDAGGAAEKQFQQTWKEFEAQDTHYQRKLEDHRKEKMDFLKRINDIHAKRRTAGIETAEPSPEQIDEELKNDLAKYGVFKHPGEAPVPPSRTQQGMARAAVAPPTAAPAPAGVRETSDSPVAKQAAEFPQEILQRAIVKLQTRPDVAEPIKQQMTFGLMEAKRMIDEAGSYDKLSPQQKKLFDQLQQAYRNLGEYTAPAPSPAALPRPPMRMGGPTEMSDNRPRR